MRAIFIADAHLRSPHDENYRLLLQFLRSLEGDADTLYVMGDLFDFWLGFPSQPFSHYDAILDALERLTRGGCRLVYFEGNHDFHIGPVFTQRLAAEVHTGPVIDVVQGRRLYLCHGDQINRDDRGYLLLRSLLHSSAVGALVGHFPPRWAERIRQLLQKNSHAAYSGKQHRWDYVRIIRDFTRTVALQGCDALVTGHFHVALSEKIPETGIEVLSLGDWLGMYTYGEMVDGQLRLRSYTPNA